MVSQGTVRGGWLPKLLRDELVSRAFWALVAALVALVVFIWNKRHAITWVGVLGYSLAVAIAASWLVVELYNRRSFRRPYYPKMLFPYEVISKTIVYRISDDCLYFKRVVTLKARVDGVDRYVDKYLWTAGEIELPHPGEGVEAIEPLTKAGIWTFYSTILDRTLRRGQEHSFEVIWPVIRNWRASSPFVSSSTEEPCKSLTFDVEIPERALRSADVFTEELRGIEAAAPFSWHHQVFVNGRLIWTMKPKVYRHYRIRWSWSGTNPVAALPGIPESELGNA